MRPRKHFYREEAVLNISVRMRARGDYGWVGARARWRVHVLARVKLCLSSIIRVCAILYCHEVSAVPWYFSILSHKWHDFLKNVIGHKMRVLIFSTASM